MAAFGATAPKHDAPEATRYTVHAIRELSVAYSLRGGGPGEWAGAVIPVGRAAGYRAPGRR